MLRNPFPRKWMNRRADMIESEPDYNLEEFQDPEDYDLEYGAYEPEGPFYETVAARTGGPILDVACGTGRIAIPLARKGYAVTGIDLTPAMLAHARRKSDGLAIDWHLADCRSFALDRRFALAVMSGNAFQACLADADQAALFAAVHRHLAPGGHFAFETRNPRRADLYGNETESFWHSFVDRLGRNIDVSLIEHYDPARSVLTCRVIRRVHGEAGDPRVTTIRIRYTAPDEINRRLADAGFAVAEQHGDFDRSALTADSPSIVTVARKLG
jgi:SAM-dependent methyltransferase